jgi:transposase
MDVKDHLSLAELKQLARAEKDAKLSKRMQMVVLALEGYTAPAIARSLSCSRRVCQHWVQRYNADGLDGLQDKPGRGKSPLLTPAEQEQLKQRIDAGPMAKDGVCSYAARIFSAFWKKILARCVRWEPFIICCINWVIRHSCHALNIAMRIPRRRRILKKVPAEDRRNPPATTRQAAEGFLGGRSSLRPTRDHHSCLGSDRLATTRGSPNSVRLSVGNRRGLP